MFELTTILDRSFTFSTARELLDYVREKYDCRLKDFYCDWLDENEEPALVLNCSYPAGHALRTLSSADFLEYYWDWVEKVFFPDGEERLDELEEGETIKTISFMTVTKK